MSKKSQVGMMEIIFIVLILFLLFTLALIGYLKMKEKDIRELSSRTVDIEAVKISQNIMSINQLQCNVDNYREDNCLELQKLHSFSDVLEGNPTYYFDIFGYSTVTVDYHNLSWANESITVYNNTKPKFGAKNVFFTPILVYNSDEKEHYFGILNIEVYS